MLNKIYGKTNNFGKWKRISKITIYHFISCKPAKFGEINQEYSESFKWTFAADRSNHFVLSDEISGILSEISLTENHQRELESCMIQFSYAGKYNVSNCRIIFEVNF